MSRPYGLIIFDLGNVLLDYDHRLSCRQLSNLSKHKHSTEEIYNFLFNDYGLSRRYDEGTITTEEFFKTVVDKFGLSVSFSEFLPIWNNIFKENKAISQLVRDLKRRYKVYLISNTNEMHFNYLSQRFRILSEFDKIFASYALGLRKPHRGIFELALKAARIKPQETIFIDDIPEHVEAASRLGIKTIQFITAKALKKQLFAWGVLT